MCFNKIFNEENNLNFEKCGEIIVSTKNNVLAIVCGLCNDLFMNTVEFMRHLQQQHDDDLRFTTDVTSNCTYTVEELLSIQENEYFNDWEWPYCYDTTYNQSCVNIDNGEKLNIEENIKTRSLSCTDGYRSANFIKSSSPKIRRSSHEPKQHINETNITNDTLPNILAALKECDLSFGLLDELKANTSFQEKEILNTGSQMKYNSMVEYVEMSSDVKNEKNEAPIKSGPLKCKSSLEYVKKSSLHERHKKPQIDDPKKEKFGGNRRLSCNSRLPNVEKSLVLDKNTKTQIDDASKDYKKNAQPLNNTLCKNIIDARAEHLSKYSTSEKINGNSSLNNKSIKVNGGNQAIKKNSLDQKSKENKNSIKQSFNEKFKVPPSISITKVPLKSQNHVFYPKKITKENTFPPYHSNGHFHDASSVVDSLGTNNISIHKTPLNRNEHNIPLEVYRCLDEQELKKHMQIIKKQIFNVQNKTQQINTDAILKDPTLKIDAHANRTINIISDENINLNGTIESVHKNIVQKDDNSIPMADIEKFIVREVEIQTQQNNKRKIKDLMADNGNDNNEKSEVCPDESEHLENISSVLSESTDRFLTDELKNANVSVSNLLETPVGSNEDNIIDELINHINNESSQQSDNLQINRAKIIQDRELGNDMQLLNCVGLKALHCSTFDVGLTLEELNANYEKSTKMANLIKSNNYLWCANVGAPKKSEQVEECFKILTEKTNKLFNMSISVNDMKRIYNLIILWYTEHCDNKLIDKKCNPSTNAYYEKLFSFMPRTARRFFYCEFCPDILLKDTKFLSHRSLHTGINPYVCKHCGRSFKIKKFFMKHQLSHSLYDESKPLTKRRRISVL